MGLPLTWEEQTLEDKAKTQENFAEKSVVRDLVRYENGVVMPRVFAEKLADRIYDMEVREDDVWIVSYPKSGTTWAIETVWMVINDVDIELGNSPQMTRCPFLESYCMIDHNSDDTRAKDDVMKELLDNPLAYADNLQGRRIFKTHLPFDFLPPKLLETCKVVYVSRNPKDTANSFYHYLPDFSGTFETFMDMFVEGKHIYGDFFYHQLSGWKNRDNPNVKFVWYEEMKKDQMGVIRDLSTFLDHPLTEDQMAKLAKHLKFENMKNNPNFNPTAGLEWHGGEFMRSGQVGDWKKYFNREMTNKWDDWIKKNVTGTGLEFLMDF